MAGTILFVAKTFVHQVKTTIENYNLGELGLELFAGNKVSHWYAIRLCECQKSDAIIALIRGGWEG